MAYKTIFGMIGQLRHRKINHAARTGMVYSGERSLISKSRRGKK